MLILSVRVWFNLTRYLIITGYIEGGLCKHGKSEFETPWNIWEYDKVV